jgi:peptidoglycan/LPS O-acetylase OafA/YrhL
MTALLPGFVTPDADTGPRNVSEKANSSHSRPAIRKFRPDIEGIRAFAVLSVVLYHAQLGVRGGFVGVDVFFVISGFLITRQLVASVAGRGVRALPTFYARRARRLLPASVAVVVATLLASRLWAPALQVQSIARDALATTYYGLNYRLAISGTQYLHETDAVSPLQHFWSLGVEEQFYLGWPILIVLIAAVGRRLRTPLLVTFLLGVVAASFYFSVTVTTSSPSWAYFSLHTRAWELALGALVAVGAQQFARLPRRVAELAAGLGLAAVVCSAFLLSAATAYPGYAAALPVVGTAVVIAAGCGRRLRTERVLGEPGLQCVGRVSYSWYLWHWPMLVLAPYLLGHPLGVLDRVAVVWLSLAAAVLTFFVIEDPARRLELPNARWFANGIALTASVITACTLVLSHLPALTGSGAAVTLAQVDSASPAAQAAMHAAVAAGVATTAVPSNLEPQPAAAAQNTPPSSRNGCHADFLSVKQGDCVFGDLSGSHTVVIFGDSHAEQWLPAVSAAAVTAHWKVVNWTKAACPAAQLSVFATSLNRQYTECDSWRAATEARIAALHPSLILVSQSENVASSSVSPAAFAGATLVTLRRLQQIAGAKVVYLQDIPVPNYDMPTCVAQHLSDAAACNFTVGKAYTYPDRHRALLAQLRGSTVPAVDPQGWLCTPSTCPAVVGNLLVYRNNTHLSADFSAWLAPLVAPLLTVK